MNVRKIRHLARLLYEEGISELEIQDGEFYLRLKKSLGKEPGESALNVPITPVQQEPREEIPDSSEVIVSPLSGTFYRAKTPGAPPFVSIGDDVPKGKTLCLLEAMKLMNELEAPMNCRIIDILVENAQSVTEGQPLFRYIPK